MAGRPSPSNPDAPDETIPGAADGRLPPKAGQARIDSRGRTGLSMIRHERLTAPPRKADVVTNFVENVRSEVAEQRSQAKAFFLEIHVDGEGLGTRVLRSTRRARRGALWLQRQTFSTPACASQILPGAREAAWAG